MKEDKKNPQKQHLALRVRTLYFGIPVLAILLFVLIGNYIIGSVSDDFARRLARQYSIETAANFLTSTNSHFVLAQQIAHSATVARWMASEDDPDIRAAAVEEIMNFSSYAPYVFLMLTAYETRNVYDLRTDFTEEDFVSWWQIEDGAQWFFDAKYAELPFELNIQRSRPVDGNFEIFVWTNHRMYYRGEFVGVVTAGSPFYSVFESIFGDFDIATRRGYIIDDVGMVRVDSAEILPVFYDGWSTPQILPEAWQNPEFTETMETHLDTMVGGAFRVGSKVHQTIALDGNFRYASIAPIVGTNWSAVVLSSTIGIYDVLHPPMIIGVFAVLIASVLLGNLLFNRMTVVPLRNLKESTATRGGQIFGLDRGDEIGDLARTILQSREIIQYREQMLISTNQAATLLLTSNENVLESIEKCMKIIGESVNAQRVHFWRNEVIDGELHFVLRHNWISDDAPPNQKIEIGMSYPYSDRHGWLDMFTKGERLNSPVSKLPLEHKFFLEQFGNKSIAIQPIFINNEFFGSISVSDCNRERTFRGSEMRLFASTGLMFANIIIRSEQETTVNIALEAERDASQLNEAILEAAPFVAAIWAEDGKPMVANHHALDFFGIDDVNEITNNLYSFSPEFQPCGTPSHEKASMYFKKAFEEGYARFEWLHKRKDGELIPAECIYMTYTRKGKTMLLSYTIDLREIKNAMDAEESNKSKSRFLARMSHEIRTPITAVLGIAEIQLRSPSLPGRLEEAFGKIHDSAHTLLHIVNDILDFSKIESGNMPILETEYEMAELAKDAAQIHTIYLEHKNINFEMHIDEHLPALLFGDVLRIRQIMSNLITNAFKYTEAGSVTLSLSCGEETDGVIMLNITIEDTGYGMTEKQLEALKTNEYTRFHELESHNIGGTGLGIPIVYNLVKIMGGTINFESKTGEGTTVSLSIPQKTCGAEQLGEEAAGLENIGTYTWNAAENFMLTPEPMPYGKVLVVDDVEANLYVAEGLLSFYELTVETCLSGREALERIEQGEVYDVILMDYLMPGMDGTETMQAMRKKGYTNPIIALTANALVGQREEYIASGFDDFVSKPIKSKLLHNVLTKFIRSEKSPDGMDSFLNDEGLMTKLRTDFLRDHSASAQNLDKYIEEGDTKSAHRLAHTIKGFAGLIGENALMQSARGLEDLFRDRVQPGDAQLAEFEEELTRVLDGIAATGLPKVAVKTGEADLGKLAELLVALEPLLEAQNAECLGYLSELGEFAEAEELGRLIENFDFELALAELGRVRRSV